MQMQSSISHGYVEMRFSGKPSEKVRMCLKGHGFRWNPNAQVWWRSTVRGAADAILAVRGILHREAGLPDGQCWSCQSPDGKFRQLGAATPVLCESCYRKSVDAMDDGHAPDVDLLYEDQCARVCGY